MTRDNCGFMAHRRRTVKLGPVAVGHDHVPGNCDRDMLPLEVFQDFLEAPSQHPRSLRFRATQPYMAADRAGPAPLHELNIEAYERGVTAHCVNGQVIVFGYAKSCLVRRPRVMPLAGQHRTDAYRNVVVEDEPHGRLRLARSSAAPGSLNIRRRQRRVLADDCVGIVARL